MLTVTVPAVLAMPPPWKEALLPEKVLLLTVSVPAPAPLRMPPPNSVALLAEKVQLFTLTMPLELWMPPP